MRRGLLRLAILAVGLVWGLTASHRTDHVWADERRIWTDAVQQAPEKPRPWVNLGNQYGNRGQLDLASDAYRTASALAQRPGRSREEQTIGWSLSETNLALVDAHRGDVEGAHLRVTAVLARLYVELDGETIASVRKAERWLAKRVSAP